MGSEWQTSKLGDVIAINPSRSLAKGSDSVYISMQQVETAKRFINEIDHRAFKGSGARFQNGDTLLARITPCLENGKTAYVDFLEEEEVAHGSTEFIVLSGIESVTDELFVYYLSRTPEFRNYAIARMEGSSGRQRVPASTLKKYTFPCPPYEEQRAIAHILGTLDDKIELNRQMNQTLEAMARAIFKSWFVDFDPVRARRGELPYDLNLPPDILNLFPDRFCDSELGEIPEGWSARSLYDSAKYINGAAYKNVHFTDEAGALPVIKIAELKNGVTGQTKFTKTELDDKYRIGDGEILLSWSGNPDTSIGTFVWCGGLAWLNQHIFRVLPHQETERHFIFYLLKYLRPVFAEIARDKQTTGLGHFTARDMKQLMVVHPPENILNVFNDSAGPMFNLWYDNLIESNTLTSLRDALLPKIISGELRVPDAEKILEEIL
ncbi:MAG: restriction endonuclease subunit S [Thermodesulfobacteriota bacterium]|nr:restriction endonuclease subunit S [Thermodesulfobacteriota bacterium]